MSRIFAVLSADGTLVHGQADFPAGDPVGAVILVAGSGLHDRDFTFGRSGTPRDRVFEDLAARMTARGLIVVRYDKRGVGHAASGLDVPVAIRGTSTTGTQVEDLRAVYDWTRPLAEGVLIFAHSEGCAIVGGLAQTDTPPPRALIGVGALLESPRAVLRWQMVERDGAEATVYDEQRRGAFAYAPTDPWPTADAPIAAAQWWQSWFTDDVPVASRLAAWDVPIILHYGDLDSQTRAPQQRAAVDTWLAGRRVTLAEHPGLGHALGSDPLIGPMRVDLADRLAREAAALLGSQPA